MIEINVVGSDEEVGGDADAVWGFTTRSMVGSESEAESGAPGAGLDVLHGPFAEGLFTEDGGAFEVLQDSGDEFGGRGRVAVDENHEGIVAFHALADWGFKGGSVRFFGASLGGNHFGLGREKEAKNLHGSIEEATGVASEIEDEGAHPLFFELVERFFEFARRLGGEGGEPNEAEGGFAEIWE